MACLATRLVPIKIEWSIFNSYVLVFVRAQSGTGKTATFSISILQCLDTQVRETQALCLSPTRELAVQIQKVSQEIVQGYWISI